MYYSKLKRYVYLFSFCVLLLSINSCKKDEASPTAVDEIPATTTEQTKTLLEGFTWKATEYRTSTGKRPVNTVTNTFLYRFVDTTGVFRIYNVGNVSPFYAEYNLTTPTGVFLVKRNTTAFECRGIYLIDGNKMIFENPSGRYLLNGTYFWFFKDTIAYMNDFPSLTSPDKYHDPSADIPMTTFSKQ